jgi:LytS/YehU family sensor histidine kinase
MNFASTMIWQQQNVLLLLAAIGSLAYALYMRWKWKQTAKQNSDINQRYKELEAKLGSIQLESLEAKLNPHLFKNILNSIQSHAYQTYFAIDKLSGVLDYMLYDSKKKFVTPKEEIDFALKLIEINKIKLSPLFELKVKLKIDESDPLYLQALIAPLVTVDLIENAFKHADLQSNDAFISIIFEMAHNHFSLTVSNKIAGKTSMKKERSGLGIDTLEQRLKIIYNDAYKLDRLIEDNVYIAHLKINLLEHKTKMFAAR